MIFNKIEKINEYNGLIILTENYSQFVQNVVRKFELDIIKSGHQLFDDAYYTYYIYDLDMGPDTKITFVSHCMACKKEFRIKFLNKNEKCFVSDVSFIGFCI